MEIDKINLERTGLNSLFSELESDILNNLWLRKSATVREVFTKIKREHKIAYPTVVVTLDRLYEKGLVDRTVQTCRGGLRYAYVPKVSRQELAEKLTDKMFVFLKRSFGESSTAYLRKKLSGGAKSDF